MKKNTFAGNFLKYLFLTFFIPFLGYSQSNDCDTSLATGFELTVGSSCTPVSFNSTNSTDYWNGASGCNAQDRDDAWGWFTATSTNTTISYTSSQDAILTLFTGACNVNMTSLACADNFVAGGTETINYATTIGTVYIVRIQRYNSNNNMTGTICVYNSTPPPSNDNCSGAITLTPNATCVTTAGTTVGATYSGPAGCSGTSDDDVWYSFTATNTDHIITVSEGTINDIVFEIFVGSCGGLTSALCVDNFFGGTDEVGDITGFTVGVTYYIRVFSWGNGIDQGTFDICITAPTPLSNDLCTDATTLNCNDVNIPGTTVGTSNTPENTPCSLSNYGVWYTFVGDGNQTTIIVTPETGFDPEMAIMSSSSDCSGTFTQVTCEDDNLDGEVESYTFDTVNGTNYYIYVADYFAGASSTFTGDFTISRTCVDTCNPTSTPNHSDLACPSVISAESITGNNPVNLDYCSGATSVNLEATYLDLGDTTSYNVTDISGTDPPFDFGCLANQVSLDQDDVWSSSISLPFNFCFYGQTYNSCVIGSNGVISFDTALANQYSAWATYENVPHPTENAYEVVFPFLYQFHYGPSIFGAHNDIDPRFGGEVGWELITLDTGCRALVASWNEVPYFLNANAGDLSKRYTGMIVLYEDTNVIEVYIKEKVLDDETSPGVIWNEGNATIAIQNANGSDGLAAPGRNTQDANWTATDEAYRFTPDGGSITNLTWYEGSGTSGPNLGSTDIITVSPLVPTTYTAAITYTLCDASTITVTDEVTVNPSGKIWLGGDTTIGGNTDPEDWMNPENWLGNSVPTISDCVIIPDRPYDPIIYDGDSGYGLNLYIATDAILTLEGDTASSPPFSGSPTASTLTIQNVINNNGTLNIQDDASLVQIDNVANIGSGITNVVRESIINDASDYVYWSTPIAGFNVGSIPGDLTYQWTPTINGYGIGNHGDWAGASGAMQVGKGYIKRASTTPSITTTFTGTNNNLNNGNISTPISSGSYTGGPYNTSGSTTNATFDDDNWNLIGNPYPSSISASDFLSTNTNIAGYINIWTHGTPIGDTDDPFYYDFGQNYSVSDYIAYNGSGPQIQNGFHGNIASGQGFMILMNHVGPSYPNNGTVTFDNSMRYFGVSPYTHYGNNQFYRTSNSSHSGSEERHRIWLSLISPSEQVFGTLVAYTENATMGKDRLYDAETNQINSMNIYSLIDNDRMVIQGRSLPFNTNDLVPMGVITKVSGIHTIAINGVDGLFDNDNQAIYLEDLELGIIHNLREQPYTFTVEPGRHDRFVLRYTNNSLSTESINDIAGLTISAPKSEYIKIVSNTSTIDKVTIYNLLGRTLLDKKQLNLNELKINHIGQGNVLLIKVTLMDGSQKIQKVVLK
ncbi:hypothetical protein C1T31_05685 [Hanstruepera neustonica]|uniref:Secretion system C-terminal sorting domain-containing protein n=1 Tax=Hanstruepera neustonica TaxID=1445657 RepID=A0A2K1E0K6_9FLAO|nr:T9SS sorting signal type C domain-containing protein [Hanstruepera neustonica]PNQ73822.1 hypothetical protein C1T31_05685 [Hanstruepera neustonica]